MLDYTLVSTKATYRMPTPRDLPGFVRLVQAFYREGGREGRREGQGDARQRAAIPEQSILATARELGTSSDRGTIFLFEKDGAVMGYAILIFYWSNELGGRVLAIDELYVEPAQRRQGIAGDFIGLLCKVAPAGVVALQLEVDRTNRRAVSLYRKLGFSATGRHVLTLPVERR